MKLLGNKKVYRVKQNVHGEIARYKARYVVKDYFQQFRVNFDQMFAIIVKPMIFCMLFIIATFHNLDINQIDIKTAFLYGFIDQLIYVKQS